LVLNEQGVEVQWSRSSTIRQLTLPSALLCNPRSNETEKHTSNDDGDGESDESEPKPLKVRHLPNPHFVSDISRPQ
jgi:hypothetical protein